MAVPQYQASLSSNVGRKGMPLRIRPTLQKNLRIPRGTVITVPYIGGSQVFGVAARWKYKWVWGHCPHSGSASNTRSSPFQGKLIRQENSRGSFASSREPYL